MNLKHSIALAMLLGSAVPMAQAEEPGDAPEAVDEERLAPGQTVKDRAHPEYDAPGIRVGSFIFKPQVKLEELYDDNIYYRTNNEIDDWVTTATPTLHLTSDWSRHSLELELGGELTRYQDHSAEDTDHHWLTAGAHIDVASHTFVTLKGELRASTESRGSPDSVNGIEPTKTQNDTLQIGFEHRPGRVFLTGSAKVENFDYDNVQTSLGTTINNNDRDRTEHEASLTLGYEITPQFDAFVRYTHGTRNYDLALDDSGFNRDSSSDTLLIGTDLDLSGVLVGEVGIGGLSYDYDDARFNDVNGTSAYSLLYWHVTPLTTVTFQLERSVSETTTANSSGYLSDVAAVSVYHELKRNLVLEGSLSFVSNDYETIGRGDDITTLSLSGEYEANRNLFLGAGYEHGERDSTLSTVDYDRDAVSFWVGLRL